MEVVPLMLRIMNADEKFMHLHEQIEHHEQMQMKNSMNLNAMTKENHFLEHVKEDYKKFSDIIVQQKRDQVKALEMLDEYISEITNDGSLSKNNVDDAKYEQKRIMKELMEIQKNLDTILHHCTF
jgi:hypothetical protein